MLSTDTDPYGGPEVENRLGGTGSCRCFEVGLQSSTEPAEALLVRLVSCALLVGRQIHLELRHDIGQRAHASVELIGGSARCCQFRRGGWADAAKEMGSVPSSPDCVEVAQRFGQAKARRQCRLDDWPHLRPEKPDDSAEVLARVGGTSELSEATA